MLSVLIRNHGYRKAFAGGDGPDADSDYSELTMAATRACLQRHMKLLEFGCGTGSATLAHAPYVAHIDASDVSAEAIAQAEKIAASRGVTNVSFTTAGFDDLEAPTEGYDMVLLMNLFHVVTDLRDALEKVHSLLKPGGLMVASSACPGDRISFVRLKTLLARHLGGEPTLFQLRAETLLNNVEVAGFNLRQQWPYDGRRNLFLIAEKTR